MRRYGLRSRLAEGKRVGLDIGSEECDLERPVADRTSLANQLVQPLLGQHAVTLFVYIESVRGAGRFSVDEHGERHARAPRRRSHHEIDVAGVEPKRDPSNGLAQYARPSLHRPLPR